MIGRRVPSDVQNLGFFFFSLINRKLCFALVTFGHVETHVVEVHPSMGPKDSS
jgi:hypothetical protein